MRYGIFCLSDLRTIPSFKESLTDSLKSRVHLDPTILNIMGKGTWSYVRPKPQGQRAVQFTVVQI